MLVFLKFAVRLVCCDILGSWTRVTCHWTDEPWQHWEIIYMENGKKDCNIHRGNVSCVFDLIQSGRLQGPCNSDSINTSVCTVDVTKIFQLCCVSYYTKQNTLEPAYNECTSYPGT